MGKVLSSCWNTEDSESIEEKEKGSISSILHLHGEAGNREVENTSTFKIEFCENK